MCTLREQLSSSCGAETCSYDVRPANPADMGAYGSVIWRITLTVAPLLTVTVAL